MTALIRPHRFSGLVRVPASKSHTIRRLIIAALAAAESAIEHTLSSLDTRSCASVCEVLRQALRGDTQGSPKRCNVGNSGTTLFFALAAASLGKEPVGFDGDDQIRRRSATPLLNALAGLGVSVKSAPDGYVPITVCGPWKGGRVNLPCPTSQYLSALLLAAPMAPAGAVTEIDVPLLNEKPYIEMTLSYLDSQDIPYEAAPLLNALAGLGVSVKSAPDGCVPITVCGPWKGRRVNLPCPTSQYLSALLLAAPMAPAGAVTEIDVPLLNEKPYIEMTLSYLDSQDIPYEAAPDFSRFRIPGGSVWKPAGGPVPADFSSAAFPAAAAAISGGQVTLTGLDPEDTQGDKAFFGFLEKMGCRVLWEQVPAEQVSLEWHLHVSRRGPLKAGEFDLNNTPDLFPALAAAACFAKGDSVLFNIEHARIKETDRIAVMAAELGKLGVKTTERRDGLVIHGNGAITPNADGGNFKTDGQGDHRVVMALAAAALGCPSPVEIAGAESVGISYPGFLELLGAELL